MPQSSTDLFTARHGLPAAVNYHLTHWCNMRCQYCFATYESVMVDGQSELDSNEAIELISMLGEGGFRKLTFSGGEPLLRSDLSRLAAFAKSAGFNVGVVTNGSRLSDAVARDLTQLLDWVGLSVDSVNPTVNRSIGRIVGARRTIRQEELAATAVRIRQIGAKLKVNTVVSVDNHREDIGSLVVGLGAVRWKILRVQHIQGENSGVFSRVHVSDAEFRAFVARARESVGDRVAICVEDDGEMIDSYVMIDPWGRFLANTGHMYRPGPRILDVGLEAALPEFLASFEAFRHRGGEYDW